MTDDAELRTAVYAWGMGKVPPVQRQDSITDQMVSVLAAAIDLGCYDAVGWIVRRWTGSALDNR